MTRFQSLLSAGCVAAGFCVSAFAAPYTQTHLAGPDAVYLPAGQSWGDTFDLNLAANEYVQSATLKFAFADDHIPVLHWLAGAIDIYLGVTQDSGSGDAPEWVNISAGLVGGSWEVDGSILSYHWITYSDIAGDNGVTDSLNAAPKGELSYLLTANSGDLFIKEVVLEANTITVPDSASTVALLGLGLSGLALWKRRK